ncbi:hypothetical protein [Halomarina rubra]|uniref:Uncharacterized protein n=1 Tax=Halomarina rubra TaxID=2071873 RepID=A0ABD6AR39_9EURY|nr:hypothetical protein [Halomarina rubra]
MVIDRALRHYRDGGVDHLLSKLRDQLDYSYRYGSYGLERAVFSDLQWYRFTTWRNQRGVDAAADPRELRWVDPEDIQRVSPFNPRFCWRKLGQVRDGDWDLDCQRFDDRFDDVIRALEARYVDGEDWADIQKVQDTLDGERWHFYRGEEVWEWVEKLDALHDSIAEKRAVPVRSLLDASFAEAAYEENDSLADRFRPTTNGSLFFGETDDVQILDWLDDIRVDVGRDGELLRHNGRHRLWFSKHLDVREVPVCVIVRHEQWQDLRDEVAAADHVDELSDRARDHLDHPDMIDVREGLAGVAEELERPVADRVAADPPAARADD